MIKILKSLLPATVAVMGLGEAAAIAQNNAPVPVPVTVTVDTTRAGPVIDRNIYGQFAEHLGRGIYEGVWVGEDSPISNTSGYRNDVVAALRRLRVPVVRWPGGCFADEYHWRDGIGPRTQRPVRVNTHWGGVTESNHFGTHEFLNFAELIGADAYVSGNLGSGTPQEMAEWVEYMTSGSQSTLANERRRNGRDRPWRVRFFGFGNETWGCGGSMRADHSADLHRRYQTFVKAPREAPIVRVASGANSDDTNFTDVMMERARGQMDALSLHYYTIPDSWQNKGPATGFGEDKWASTLRAARRIDDLITRHKAVMDRHDPERRVGLFVDEWGAWYEPEPGSTPGFLYQQNTLRDAHVAALSLNIFHRHTDRVRMTNIAQMVNVLQAMILTDGPRMLLTPTYHVFEMYVPFQGATPLAATVEAPEYRFGDISLPRVDVSAARDTSGRLHLALVNLDPNRPARVVTNVTGMTVRGARGRLLTGPALDTHNSFDQPDRIQPAAYSGRVEGGRLVLDLPAKSVAVVAVE
ncbi:alpha-L-arabinofuranosidase C-terminal domain-containing protein [Sphingosinicella sp. LHD-64]|uniref:alpha-N-arabinofuranosidase n=1 Tax=Sphingosinicella sp. LHD-64 TaxID=3072139 RepID=UPI00280DABD6|nr:alpha-L-arabinofuranosidase C-terminal domain-containing protein [Sphingosinicella sp. LHD-64]MDQ8755190.1 alpha-L-arabinofuranosidase C-terminal domain-containing protein [Sphingosinicella sp. LHD-64]